MIYRTLPDGSSFDHNRVFDIIDATFVDKKKTVKFKEAERFMLQYVDAMKSNDAIWERYDNITSPYFFARQRFMKNPTARLEAKEESTKEKKSVGQLVDASEEECLNAWHRVAWMISHVKKREQKLIMAAHYICGADWKWISAVYEHQARWAKDKNLRAMTKIVDLLRKEENFNCSPEIEDEMKGLIEEWKLDEMIFKEVIGFKPSPEPVNDKKLILGLYWNRYPSAGNQQREQS